MDILDFAHQVIDMSEENQYLKSENKRLKERLEKLQSFHQDLFKQNEDHIHDVLGKLIDKA